MGSQIYIEIQVGWFRRDFEMLFFLIGVNKMFTPIASVYRYPTSSSRKRVFVKPKTNKSVYRNWISSTDITLWESIDPKLKTMSYNAFKKSYRSFIIDNY